MARMFEPDSGYSWLVAAAALLTHIINGGVFVSCSLFLVEWYEVFGASKSATTWVVAILTGTSSVTGVFAGGFVNRFGCRRVLLAGTVIRTVALLASAFVQELWPLYILAVIAGAGSSLMQNPPVVVIYHYFDRHKSLASGFSLMGTSLASFVMIAVMRTAIDHYGWRGAMVILAGINLNGCVMAMLMMPNNASSEDEGKNEKSPPCGSSGISSGSSYLTRLLRVSLLRDACFLLNVVVYITFHAQLTVLLNLSTSRGVSKGLTLTQASYLPALVGLGSTASRVVTSWLSSMACTSHVALFALSEMILAGAMVTSCWRADEYIYAASCCLVAGVFVGSFGTVQVSTLVDLVGQKNLASAYGWTSTFLGIQSFYVLPLAGFIYDRTEDFNSAFYFTGGLGLFGGLFGVVLIYKFHRQITDMKPHQVSLQCVDAEDCDFMDDINSTKQKQKFHPKHRLPT